MLELSESEKYPQRIEGEHIILRKAKSTDGTAMYNNYWSDTTIADKMFWQPSSSPDEVADRLERTIKFQSDKDMYFIALKDTDEPIGMAGIHSEGQGVYSESGIGIARKYQHRGYGKEVLRLLLNLAFEYYGASQFVYYCMEQNEVSKKIAQGFGFRYDSVSPEIREYDGKKFNVQRYVLDRDSFEL